MIPLYDLGLLSDPKYHQWPLNITSGNKIIASKLNFPMWKNTVSIKKIVYMYMYQMLFSVISFQ